MGVKFKMWIRDVGSKLASQAVVSLIFVTIPLLYNLWEWRNIIIADHARQVSIDSTLVVHLQEAQIMKGRIEEVDRARRMDSIVVSKRLARLETHVPGVQATPFVE